MPGKTNSKSSQNNSRLSWQKKLGFNLILLLIPVVLILILEFSLRIIDYGNDLTLFVESENYSGHYEINRKVNLRYFTKVEETSPTNDIFLINKPDSCYRIVVFGGSTTRGFPFQAGTSFPRILYYRLQDAFPEKRVEVINLSASAINSYSYIDMVDEVFQYQPDLLLVYGGHNEYYGALGAASIEGGGNRRWIKKLRLKLIRFKTFQLTQNTIAHFASLVPKKSDDGALTLMERIVKDKDILYDSELYRMGVKHFTKNMNELVAKAHRKNVPVILSELVSNVEDQVPFKSLNSAEFPSAIDVYNKALAFKAVGKMDSARFYFYQAKDLDVIRFRAPEELNDVIHNICTENELVCVPMKKYFEAASPDGFIGKELMMEHLHPTIDGYFLMADAFFQSLKENGFIAELWDEANLKPADYYRNNWGFTELDSLIGYLNIESLKSGWPFQNNDDPNAFLRNYQYTNFVDSLAFNYLIKKERHIEDEHIKLAEYYTRLGRKDKVFEEYFSLIKLHPYIPFFYNDAAKNLIALKRYTEALTLLEKAPILEKDYYYYYLRGTLRLKLNDPVSAIPDLEISYRNHDTSKRPGNILVPLYAAYGQINDSLNAARVLALIQQLKPDFKQENAAGNKKVVSESGNALNTILNKARDLFYKKEFEKALELLFEANSIQETVFGNKLIGSIYLMQHKHDLAFEFTQKAYEMNPKEVDILNNLFVLSLMKNDLEGAGNLLEETRQSSAGPEKLERMQKLYDKKRTELQSK